MMFRSGIASVSAALLATCSAPLFAQDETQPQEETPEASDGIIVSGESVSERVRALGRQITRPARFGKPIARFDAPLCIKVSGMPDDIATIIKTRIEENARQLRGVKIDEKADCDPNAFVGTLNNVNEAVKKLEKEEPWLFQGLLSFQKKRIYRGSDAVRAWHIFSRRNLDGSSLPIERRNGEGAAELVNTKEVATRFIQERMDISGAVVLMETSALRGKTLRQIADYATIRLLASVSDELDLEPGSPPSILTLFEDSDTPDRISDFDLAYLQALYELPPNSRDGAVIAAVVKRFEDQLEIVPDDTPEG